MDREEFIKVCARSGYASKEVAKAYAGEREEFSERDFEEVFRFSENVSRRFPSEKWGSYQGTRSTKRYFDDAGNR